MRAVSTAPAGLRSYKPAVDDQSDTLFHVYGVSVYGELLGLGGVRDGLDPLECLGPDAVRDAVRTKTHGWDLTAPWSSHPACPADKECAICDGTADHISLPLRQPVRAWRVVDTDRAGGALPAGNWLTTNDPVTDYEPGCRPGVGDAYAVVETWVNTADGPMPLSQIV